VSYEQRLDPELPLGPVPKLPTGQRVKAVPAERLALWDGYSSGMLELEPSGFQIPAPFLRQARDICCFRFEPSDVLIMTYPKCGTTWTQEMVWTLRNSPNLDHPMAPAPVNIRAPFIEMDCLLASDKMARPGPDHPLMKAFRNIVPDGDPAKGLFLQMAQHTARPRTLKTHLPFSLLPKDLLDTVKVVYVARDPKDVAVSYLHHCRLMRVQEFLGTNQQFVDSFVKGDLLYGAYDAHLTEAFERRDHPNLLVVRFEDLKGDHLGELSRLNTFLGTGVTEEQLKGICHYTSFAEMKKRDNALSTKSEGDQDVEGEGEGEIFNMDVVRESGGFFRKGITGDWKAKLTIDQAAKIDRWTAEKLGDIAKHFKYM